MGYTRWDPDAFKSFTSTHTAGKSRAEVFKSRDLKPEFDPSKFDIRESRDSVANPLSTAIGLFSDVTGSMGMTAENMIRNQVDLTMREIDRRRPVTDPHILCGAVGDAFYDRAPIQMTQFEGGLALAEQLKDIWIESGGGANDGESYLAAHFGMGMKTSIDCFEKRGQKGYLFTIGDEPALNKLTKDQIKKTFGLDAERDLTAAECLAIAQRQYEVFHIVLSKVGYAQRDFGKVMSTWTPLLGQRVLVLDDHTKVAELVVSTLQVLAGDRVNDVAASWSGTTAITIANAIGGLAKTGGPSGGVVRF